jgi:hypothetical protein
LPRVAAEANGGVVFKSSWFRKYFGNVGRRLAAGVSAAGSSQPASDPKVRAGLVLAALADERFHFRTVPTIAAETGIPETIVRSILEQHREEVRKVPLYDAGNSFLYTLRSRPRTAREILAETRAFLAGSPK